MILADVRSEGDSVLDLLVTEGTVEGQTVDVIALNVFPEVESGVSTQVSPSPLT